MDHQPLLCNVVDKSIICGIVPHRETLKEVVANNIDEQTIKKIISTIHKERELYVDDIFLALPNYNYIVFRPTSKPIIFNGIYYNFQLELTPKGNPFYLIPGISRKEKKDIPAYLLLNKTDFSIFRETFNKHKYNRDIVISFGWNYKLMQSRIKCFVNAPTEISKRVVEKNKVLIEFASTFLEKYFNMADKLEYCNDNTILEENLVYTKETPIWRERKI